MYLYQSPQSISGLGLQGTILFAYVIYILPSERRISLSRKAATIDEDLLPVFGYPRHNTFSTSDDGSYLGLTFVKAYEAFRDMNPFRLPTAWSPQQL